MGKIITCIMCKEEKELHGKNMCLQCYSKNYKKDKQYRLIENKHERDRYNNLGPIRKRSLNTYKQWLNAWREKQIPYNFNLNKKELMKIIVNLFTKNIYCKKCGIETTLHENIKGRKYVRTLDRIDNNKGHIEGNLQVLCVGCNARKDNHYNKQ